MDALDSKFIRLLTEHVAMPFYFKDYIYKGQLIQGEALKTCLESDIFELISVNFLAKPPASPVRIAKALP